MELRQLSYFEAVAQNEHIGIAAAKLGIDESTLSRSVGRLEGLYGPLFDRVGRNVRLNTCGRILLNRVGRALAELNDAAREIAATRAIAAVAVRLGFVPSLGMDVVPRLVGRFRAKQPESSFSFIADTPQGLQQRLLRGQLDLCLSTEAAQDERISWEPLWHEELVALVPPLHPLARRRRIPFSELANEPLLSYPKGHTLRSAIEQLSADAGFPAQVVMESDDVGLLIGLAAEGFGIAPLPEVVIPNRGRAVVVRFHQSRWRTIGISCLSTRGEQDLIDTFREFLKAIPVGAGGWPKSRGAKDGNAGGDVAVTRRLIARALATQNG